MRWYKKQEKEYRVKKSFLLLPKCINGECRWLERATYKQKIVEIFYYDEFGPTCEYIWEDVMWMD